MELDRGNIQERHGGMVLDRILKIWTDPRRCTRPEQLEKKSQEGKCRFIRKIANKNGVCLLWITRMMSFRKVHVLQKVTD